MSDIRKESRIAVGHLLTTLVLIVSGISFMNDLTTEAARQRVEIDGINARLSREVIVADDGRTELAHSIQRLDYKLDKILEKVSR